MKRFTIKLIVTANILLFSFINNFAQIVNEGIFKIKDGTTVYFGEEYTNKVGATHNNEGNLHLNSNFINNGTVTESGVPDSANGQTIFDSPTNVDATTNAIQTISGTTKVAFENLIVDNTTGVSVADGMELIVEKGVTLTSGDLRMIGESQLIQKHTGADANSGTQKLLLDQQGTKVTYDYNYWSSPVSGATLGQYQVGEVLFDGTDSGLNPYNPTAVTYTGSGAPYNGTPSVVDGSGNVTTPLNIESYWMWKFDNGTIDDDNDWVLIRDNNAINAGLGYTMKGSGTSSPNQNYVFKGKPNDGNYSISIDNTKSTLLGNPYPCALDADAFITANANVLVDVSTPDPGDPPATTTTGALYFWEHWGGGNHFQASYQGGYATYTLAGGVAATSLLGTGGSGSGFVPPANYKIPVAQGFFIESGTGGPHTIVFNNSMRKFEKEGANSNYFRPENNSTEITNEETTNEDTTPRIRLGYNNPINFYRQIMTAFIPECTNGQNIAYDARMADVNTEDMYWVTDDTPFVIDARAFNLDQEIQIGITVVNNGTHTISIDSTENFDSDMYILDTDTGFTHDLRQSNFEVILNTGIYDNRFKLVFRPATVVSTDDALTHSINVFYAPNSKNVIIDNFDNLTLKSAKIYNAIGQLIKTVPKKELILNKITIPFNVASGTYFINVESNKGKGDFKVIAY